MEIASNILRKSKQVIVLSTVILSVCCPVKSQSTVYNYFYRVYFRDKGDYNTNNFSAADLLSEKAIARRHKAGISVPDFNDLPVFQGYINQILTMGYKLHCTSKWMNTGLFKTQLPADVSALLNLSFVKDVRVVKRPSVKSKFENKLDFNEYQNSIPSFDRPVEMVNGNTLHHAGYIGNGIIIAVLDGGFFNADQISSLNNLRSRNGIKIGRASCRERVFGLV
jgi:serine protease AprX